jgi:hypothetical protein
MYCGVLLRGHVFQLRSLNLGKRLPVRQICSHDIHFVNKWGVSDGRLFCFSV